MSGGTLNGCQKKDGVTGMMKKVVAWMRGIFKRPEYGSNGEENDIVIQAASEQIGMTPGQMAGVIDRVALDAVTEKRAKGRQRAKRMGVSKRDWEKENGRKWVPV